MVEEPIRVLLLEVPQLLRGILEHAIQQQSDCELVSGARRDFESGPERIEPPDVVILGITVAEDTMLVPALLARWPGAQVMTVMQRGDEAAVYELRPRRRVLEQVSPEEILASLRVLHRSRELPQE